MLPSLVLLFISTTLVHLCSCVQLPELVLLTGGTQRGGTFCPRETAQLKCIFPEGKLALEWYVNASEIAYDVDFLAQELPGHNATTPFDNYTIVSIFKEGFYRGNYSCAVKLPGDDAMSNSVEVLFEDPDDFRAVCLSSDSDSISVAVNYTNGCKRETVVQASGKACDPLLESPSMTIFQCGDLYPNTSYNITADSHCHTHSLTCSTMEQLPSVHGLVVVYLAFLGVIAPAIVLGVVLGLLLYRCRKRQHGCYLTKDTYQLESKVEETCHRYDSEESRESSNSTNPHALLALHQVDDCDQDVKYAHLDHSGPRSIPAPSPHERVKYATIQPEQ